MGELKTGQGEKDTDDTGKQCTLDSPVLVDTCNHVEESAESCTEHSETKEEAEEEVEVFPSSAREKYERRMKRAEQLSMFKLRELKEGREQRLRARRERAGSDAKLKSSPDKDEIVTNPKKRVRWKEPLRLEHRVA